MPSVVEASGRVGHVAADSSPAHPDPSTDARDDIRCAVVIGGGTMGSGIAELFASVGIRTYLLDIATLRAPVAGVAFGHIDHHEQWIAEADWIVEAIYENLDAKRDLVARIDRLRRPDSIVSSNTSGLPIASLAAHASPGFKQHFLGTHFFNPPRVQKLLEVIPTPDTLPEVTRFVREFAEERFDKGVVICKDTPNFIANRLASISGASLTDFALAHDYTIEEVDAIAGPLIGRPKSTGFRLQDLVGLDVVSAVAANLYDLIPHDEAREVLRSPRIEALRKSQMEGGRLGDKTGQGFYKKGGPAILTLDLHTGEYRERIEPQIPSLAVAATMPDLRERLTYLLAQDDKAGALARHTIYQSLAYASHRIPEISDDVASIDRVMRWGFSHELGPFELWELLGMRETTEAMERSGYAVAPWVHDRLAAGHETFA